MKRLILGILTLAVIYLGTSGYSAGPALGSGLNRTGSKGSTIGCGQGCHTASTNSMITITLDSAGTPKTIWYPGVTYTIKLHGTNTANLGAFGFQFSVVKGVGNAQTQAGVCSNFPVNVHSAVVTGLNIIEHGDQLPPTTPGVYDVQFSWTSPAAGAGTISMYAVLNAVNNNNSDNGDQYNNAITTFAEGVVACPLPVVSTQPLADTVCAESPASFSVTTTSSGVTYQWYKAGVAITGATSSTYSIPSTTVGSAGYYKVRLTNICGNILSDSVLLTVNALPTPTIVQAGLNLSTGVFVSYQWLKNNIIIPGATSQAYNVTTVGTYRVKVTNVNACTDTSAGTVISSVGVTEVNSNEDISIYPNPASKQLNIETTLSNYKLSLINLFGQVVMQRTESGRAVLDIAHLQPGIYYICVATAGGEVMNKKIVVQH